ncbi:pseudouridine synthase [Microvirga solisilvae]|uniref:pseudouridine synthase n=1 Tax=Microvirga solisilvae TaxID=2919498 RepID=UPI001FAFE561|nr:pseudouridine synthase [Microvirga solisilvae]
MTDSNDDNRKGRSSGRSDRGRTSGDRPFRKPREGGERPFRARGEDDRPRKPRDAGDKPFRSRDNDERPRRPRAEGDKPFRARREDGDRPFRSRPEGGDKPFRARREDGDRPFRSRSEGSDKPFRARREDGDRPFRERSERGDKPFRPRRDEGDRPFRGRGGDDRPRRFDRSAEDRPRRPREERPEVQAEVSQEPSEERIAKVIARAGIASRRDVEAMIAEGRITLNGKVLESPAINVTAADKITVDGEPLPTKERTRLWLYHKPRGLVTTARDPEGRPTVFENLPEDLPRVVAVGRLDINTEGLLLLTNDGGLARVIAHPDTGWLRRYKVRAHGDITQADLDGLRDGITIDGIEYGPVEARLDRVQGDNVWITMGLREGKNREIKRILEHLGMQVNRLIRMSFGPFQLGDLEQDLVEEVKTKILKDQLGAALAAEAGVDFESPVREPIAPFGSSKKDRDDRDERPARFGRGGDERPRRRDDDEKPFRSRGKDRFEREEEEPKKRPSRLEAKKSVWRAGESDEDAPRKRAPRRGADPREARAASAERPRERVGAISSGEGRKVVVERLVRQPQEEQAPAPRKGRGAGRDDDRPRRRDDRDAAPARRGRDFGAGRPRRDDDERPRRPAGDRPFRSREGGEDRPRKPQGDRPFRARSEGGDERPRRGPPRGDGPSRGGPRGGGFKGGPRGASKGGFKGGSKGGSKGGPRGRR